MSGWSGAQDAHMRSVHDAALIAEVERLRAIIEAVETLADRTRTYGGSDIEGWVNLANLRNALRLPHHHGSGVVSLSSSASQVGTSNPTQGAS